MFNTHTPTPDERREFILNCIRAKVAPLVRVEDVGQAETISGSSKVKVIYDKDNRATQLQILVTIDLE